MICGTVSLLLLKAGYRADDWNGSEPARCAFPINHPDRERQQHRARSAISVRLPITGPSAFHHVATFAIFKAAPESRLSAVAQSRSFRRSACRPKTGRSSTTSTFPALHPQPPIFGKAQLGTGFVKAVALAAAKESGHCHLARPFQSGISITNQLASKSPLMALLTMAPNSITPMCISINHHKFDVATYAIVKASADTMLPTNRFGVLNPCAAPYARAAMMIAPDSPIFDGR